jgi:integrase
MPRSSAFVLSTDREIRGARSRGKRKEFRIKGVTNLVLRVNDSGAKTWVFLYASPATGRRAKLTFGTYPALSLTAARDAALALTVAVKGGQDPAAKRRAQHDAESFGKLAEAYLREHEQKLARDGKSGGWTAEVKRLLSADILPKIGAHRAEAITKQHVMGVIEPIVERGAYVTADHVLGLVRAIYNWAAGTGRLEVNPTFGLKKRHAARPRERVLSDNEIRKLWQGLDARPGLSPEIRDALKLQLLLGLRRGEVLGAAKREVDLERAVWVLPAERTKSRREHVLPLSAMALRILDETIRRAGESEWLFPSSAGSAPMRARSASRALLRMRGGLELADVGTHDLRRTLATGLGNLDVRDEVIERVLNHAPRTVAGRHYNHAKHFDAMKNALESWSARVQGIVDDKVIASNMFRLC